MHIAIIGGGFTGLSAAYELVKKGHQVTVFEKEKTLGGLAHGFKEKNWDWHLESAYHHLFTNDHAILNLIKELGLSNKLILTRPMTANFIDMNARGGVSFRSVVTALAKKLGWRGSGADIDDARTRHADQSAQIIPFHSPIHLLTYPGLSWLDKLRTGALVALAKLYPAPLSRTKWSWVNPFWQPLESITAKKLFVAIGGSTAWKMLWEPLMLGKFGTYSESICASWLLARIKKRTQKLYYIQGGFHTLVTALEEAINLHGGKIFTGVSINNIKKSHSSFIIHHSSFDRVLLTIPTPIASNLLSSSDLPVLSSPPIPHLHAQTLILETKEPILKDTYWLNVMDRTFPFLAVVAHTNMIDAKHYGGHHLTYFGNYLAQGHPYLSMTKKQLLKVFLPFINRLNPSFHSSFIIHHSSFTAPFAQPVHELHYSCRAPKLETPIPGIYLANMDSIYPWDRGTNYAVELGLKAAHAIGHSHDHNVVIPA